MNPELLQKAYAKFVEYFEDVSTEAGSRMTTTYAERIYTQLKATDLNNAMVSCELMSELNRSTWASFTGVRVAQDLRLSDVERRAFSRFLFGYPDILGA